MIKDISNKPLLLNRDISLLNFNERIMSMVEDKNISIIERLRFLCIVSSNLDEFFEVRFPSLKEQQYRQDFLIERYDGFTLFDIIKKVMKLTHEICNKQYSLLNNQILPELEKENIFLLSPKMWNKDQYDWAMSIFENDIMPLLTPIGLDPSHPFPRVYNKSLNFIISLSGANDAFNRLSSVAIIQAPNVLPTLMQIPSNLSNKKTLFVLTTSILKTFVNKLFIGLNVNRCYQWRVTRNSNLFVDEEEMIDLREALQGELSQRNFGAAVRLEIDEDTPKEFEKLLQREFSLSENVTYRVKGPVNIARLMPIYNFVRNKNNINQNNLISITDIFNRNSHKIETIFEKISKQDILLHHPYQSFQTVLDFLASAAYDPNVVVIKQTIYRTGEDSELMKILLYAAKMGKEVTVILELMARFDEQTNINWAARLEEVGAHVIYGVVAYKVHAKMAMIVRREKNKIKKYVHISTGNYHSYTASCYTDFGLITANEKIANDIDKIFLQLTGFSARLSMQSLLQSPFTLRDAMIAHIKRESLEAIKGKKAIIMAKMNALLEPGIIKELYTASQAGVKIDLIVRGACALRAGVPNLSDNIRVRSIIGKYLEHSRVFYFYSAGEEIVYLSSADWMDRNLFRRVEIAFPIYDKILKKRIIQEAFIYAFQDNQLSWEQIDGNYIKIKNIDSKFNVQNYLDNEINFHI
ncbi:Polyphosphate kinase [Candidatus Kinetoplastibacterium sorsogonicusi]|uniref:Polyphosphate kinase n=1 Tax=Candidatus Kinetoplastidibacterium kentomonadis TaxID=1576550 RepID=A0A3Q8EWS6_9PROT|nr:polyphosphate kinase 1 [Candidatus Kinetoplastibacterium sorsogonicusi]AWD32286.1 Polyphosphate kinase [Candidatus Kinetoplastibacterium sorsogonicusi]